MVIDGWSAWVPACAETMSRNRLLPDEQIVQQAAGRLPRGGRGLTTLALLTLVKDPAQQLQLA
jgi:hypothetical protein